MTSRPQLRLGRHLLPGLAAVALFAIFVLLIAGATFDEYAGFPTEESILENIGFALLNIDAGGIPVAGFLVAFIAIAVVLDAALGGAVMLATRDDEDGGDR